MAPSVAPLLNSDELRSLRRAFPRRCRRLYGESVWQQRYAEPKEPFSYFRLRTVMTPEGRVTRSAVPWLSYQTNLTITDNPRLMAESQRGPMFMVRPMSQQDYERQETVPESEGTSRAPLQPSRKSP